MLGRLCWVATLVGLALVPSVRGQNLVEDRPKVYAKQPPTREEADRRESLKKYVAGLLLERDDRLLEALKTFEEAARLDPAEPAVYKAQISLLMALDRAADALATCKKVVELDPDDFETWYAIARLQKFSAKYDAALAALEQGVQSRRLKDRPEFAQQMYLELGSIAETSEAYGKAADAFRKAAQILEHPDRILEKGNFSREAILARAAETYERIGDLHRKARQFEQALEAYKTAQQRAPDRAGRLNLHLAQLCHENDRPADALTYVDAYLRLQPLGLEAYEMKIALLLRFQRAAEIVPWLQACAEANPNHLTLQFLLADEYARAGQAPKAITHYLKFAEASPSPELYRGLFKLYRQTGQMAACLRQLDQAVGQANAKQEGAHHAAARGRAMLEALRHDSELCKALVQAAFTTPQDQPLQFDTLHFLAVAADRNRKPDEAERFYRQCLPRATPANEALIYGGLLRVLARARKFDAVIQVCNQGLQQAQATNRLLFCSELARAHAGLEKFDDALLAADRAIDLAGDDNKLSMRLLRLRVLLMADRAAQAEKDCLELLKTHVLPAETLELRYLLSGIYSALKEQTKAEEQLQLILRLDPSNATANNDLGYLWADQNKNLAEAEDMIRRAIEVDRRQRKLTQVSAEADVDNASYVDSLGWVLFRRGQLEAARQEFERATQLPDSDDPVIWDHLGDVYARLNQAEQARAAWQRAVRLYEDGRRRGDDRLRELHRKLRDFSR